MAVGTQELEVLKTIVRPVPVDVVKLHVQRLATPVADPALFTPVGLQAFLQEPNLQVAPTCLAPDHEKLFNRHHTRTGDYIASHHGLMPACEGEAKPFRALTDRQSGVVYALDLSPVVPPGEPLVGLHTESSDVEGNRAFRDSQTGGNLSLIHPAPIELMYQLPGAPRGKLGSVALPAHSERMFAATSDDSRCQGLS